MSPRAVVMAALALLVATVEVAAQVKNYEAPGNLESGRDLGCVTPTALRNTYTPADLYPAVGRCVQQGAYREAAFLFALAGVYGRYGTLRVADRTAHQALAVLQIDTFGALSKDRETAFKEALRSALGSSARLSDRGRAWRTDAA